MTTPTFRPTLSLDLSGSDGNIFAVVGAAGRILKQLDRREQRTEMQQRVLASQSYQDALGIVREYVDLIDLSEEE